MPDDVRKPAIDKSHLPSRHVTVGPERAPHRAFLYSMGLTEEQIGQPLVGVATTWNEAAPCNIALAARRRRPRRACRGARHPARVHHDHGDRRHRDGPCRDEGLADQPRGHRRLGRADDARALLRRAGRAGRLRQVAARDDDGDGAAQRAVGLHVWRLDPARAVPRPAT